jgi:hypothetical protein
MQTCRVTIQMCVAVTTASSRIAAQASHFAGITYVLGPESISGEPVGGLKRFAGVVVFAAGRGRLDIESVSKGPEVTTDGIRIGNLLAGSGDYLLFDSTGFILVRPASKTFSSFQLTDAAYDYRYSRDGWPAFFNLSDAPSRLDTVTSPAAGKQFGDIRIYWHLNLISGGIIAGGRLAVAQAPPAEASVVRWFGPSQALANMTAAGGSLPRGLASLTSVVTLHPLVGERPQINFFNEHMLWGIKPIDVDGSRLVLPDEYTETQWPGFEGQSNAPAVSTDGGARWRVGLGRPASPSH